ncbi:MAG: TetR/AcrR family transcriptional regulator [Dietzia sp.]
MTSTTRREELLAIAAGLFAERGLRATTVRDIADAAGILSGSLYHHFSSKEAIVDEILRGFLDSLFGDYRRIVDAGSSPRETLEGLVRASFEAIHRHRAEVAIYQDELKHLRGNPRFDYLRERNTEFREMWTDVLSRGMESGEFRPDLDIRLTYRFLRDTVWVAVRWYRPDDADDHAAIADQYLHIVLDGLAVD